MLSNIWMTPFCCATKTRPSAAQRIVVGKFRPDQTVVSVKPAGSQRAGAAIRLLVAAESNGLTKSAEEVAGRVSPAAAQASRAKRRRRRPRTEQAKERSMSGNLSQASR